MDTGTNAQVWRSMSTPVIMHQREFRCRGRPTIEPERHPHVSAAIDFGISNTDAVAMVDGEMRRWTRATVGRPTHESVRDILAAGGVKLEALASLAVTGGQHSTLPTRLGATMGPSRPAAAARQRTGVPRARVR